MKTMEQFLDEITTDKELAEKLAAVKDEGELAELLKEKGTLSDEELEGVAGGNIVGDFIGHMVFMGKLYQSLNFDRARLEEIMRKLQNKEITYEEIEEKYLK